MGEIAPEEQFLPLSTIFYDLMLDFYVKTGIRFALRDKRLFEITEVEITRVDCNLIFCYVSCNVSQCKPTLELHICAVNQLMRRESHFYLCSNHYSFPYVNCTYQLISFNSYNFLREVYKKELTFCELLLLQSLVRHRPPKLGLQSKIRGVNSFPSTLFLTSGLVQSHHLDELISSFRGFRWMVSRLLHFAQKYTCK